MRAHIRERGKAEGAPEEVICGCVAAEGPKERRAPKTEAGRGRNQRARPTPGSVTNKEKARSKSKTEIKGRFATANKACPAQSMHPHPGMGRLVLRAVEKPPLLFGGGNGGGGVWEGISVWEEGSGGGRRVEESGIDIEREEKCRSAARRLWTKRR
ncbi:hypothetical protein B0H19DRAFT_1063438 [Mycena capillaripes]|nr:hypothetical protein B0H19DRAFT_1063438 [Mycena capillaripes]